MKNILINILKFVLPLSLGIFLIWLISKDLTDEDINNIKESFRTADYRWVFLSLLLGFLSHFSRAMRWLILLEPLGHKPKLSNSFYTVMIGYIANLAFPRLGEVSRCGAMNRTENVPFTAAFGTVVAERIIDLLILLSLTFIVIATQFELLGNFVQTHFLAKAEGMLADGQGKLTWMIVIGFTAILVLGVGGYFLRSKAKDFYLKLKSFLMGFAQGLITVKNVKRKGAFVFHTLFIWLMYVLMCYVCFFAFPETSGLSFGAVLSCFVFGSFGIVFVQGGIGAYPVIIMMTLELYGISAVTGFAFGWLVWTAQTFLILVLGFISLILISATNKRVKNDEPVQA